MVGNLHIQYPGAIYHFINRVDWREPILGDEADRLRFIEHQAEACGKTGLQVY